MPICHRCGKVLRTEQSLYYHLNKKFKCNFAHKCQQCKVVFNTKLALTMHETICIAVKADIYLDFCQSPTNKIYALTPAKMIKNTKISYLDTLHPKLRSKIEYMLEQYVTKKNIFGKKNDDSIIYIDFIRFSSGYYIKETVVNRCDIIRSV